MFTIIAATLFAFFAFAVAASNVLNPLPSCWDDCSTSAAGGQSCSWYDTTCICDLSNNTPYLANIVTCARKTCDKFKSKDVDIFLSPIDFTCSLVPGGIKQSRFNAARAAARASSNSNSDSSSGSISSSNAGSSYSSGSEPQSHLSSSAASPTPQTTPTPTVYVTTLRATTTTTKGSAVTVVNPVSYGPDAVSSGVRNVVVLMSTVEVVPVPVTSATTTILVIASGTPKPSDSSSTMATDFAASTPQSEGQGSLFDSQNSAGSQISLRGGAALTALIVCPLLRLILP